MDLPSSNSPNTLHYYQAFGLQIRSCLPLPALAAMAKPEFDVDIKYGPVLSSLPGAEDTGLRYQTAPGRLLLLVDRIARFLVTDGNKVLIDRHEGADEDAIRLFLLGPVFSGLLQQREDLVLRGSAIAVNGRGVAFLGPSGVGKSILAMAFKKKGYRFLTDDLCVLRAGPEAPRMIQPGVPEIKLWQDSLMKLGLPVKNFKRVRRKLQKRALPIEEASVSEPLPIGKAYMLRSIATESVKLTKLDGSAAYASLEHQPHFSPFLDGLGMAATYRQLAMTLALTIPFSIVDRPRKKFHLPEMMDLLEADFLE